MMITIEYHQKVYDDFRKVGPSAARVIRKAIDEKLASDPAKYGKPLSGTLKNLRSLRVGSYRVVYELREGKIVVFVLMVGKREDVYDEVMKRLN